MDALVRIQDQNEGRGGCPIGNLVGQLGEQDDDIRAILASGYNRWQAHISAGLAAMVTSGELVPDIDVEWLAAATLASVEGGLVLTQARRDPQALRRALDGALAYRYQQILRLTLTTRRPDWCASRISTPAFVNASYTELGWKPRAEATWATEFPAS